MATSSVLLVRTFQVNINGFIVLFEKLLKVSSRQGCPSGHLNYQTRRPSLNTFVFDRVPEKRTIRQKLNPWSQCWFLFDEETAKSIRSPLA